MHVVPRPGCTWGTKWPKPEKLKQSLLYKGNTNGAEDIKYWEDGKNTYTALHLQRSVNLHLGGR